MMSRFVLETTYPTANDFYFSTFIYLLRTCTKKITIHLPLIVLLSKLFSENSSKLSIWLFLMKINIPFEFKMNTIVIMSVRPHGFHSTKTVERSEMSIPN